MSFASITEREKLTTSVPAFIYARPLRWLILVILSKTYGLPVVWFAGRLWNQDHRTGQE